IARQSQLSRQWWAYLADTGQIDPDSFIHAVPHMDVVFGTDDVDYLRRRFETMRTDTLFAGMAYSDDPAQIATWAPLVTGERDPGQPIAATWHPDGTDIDFGALTRQLATVITASGGRVRCGH